LIATACSDGALRLWAAEAGGGLTAVLGVRVHAGVLATCLAWAPDGRGALAVGAADGSLALLDIRKPTSAVWRGSVGPGSGPAYGCAFVGGGNGGGRPLLAVAARGSGVALFDPTAPAAPPAPIDWLLAARAPPHTFLCVAARAGGGVVAAGDAVEGGRGRGGAAATAAQGRAGHAPRRAVWTNAPGEADPPPDPAHPPKRDLWAPITVFEPRDG
jgi:hypothetical protein